MKTPTIYWIVDTFRLLLNSGIKYSKLLLLHLFKLFIFINRYFCSRTTTAILRLRTYLLSNVKTINKA